MTDNQISNIDLEGLYPAPFPENVAVIDLPLLSLDKIARENQEESHRLVEILQDTGFFHLDLTDHPEGMELLEDAVACCRLTQQVLTDLSVEDKVAYKPRDRLGTFDRGYVTKGFLPNGQPRYHETVNVPMTEMFSSESGILDLPFWLAPHRHLFESIMKRAHGIAIKILSVLETSLELAPGSLTSTHPLGEPSGGFLQLLRYAGLSSDSPEDELTFPAHKDYTSISILFNWLGGLQMPARDATWVGPLNVSEESWRWVKPVRGTAIVNVGKVLEYLTGGTLKAGLHRVVRAPGAQAPFDKYSVLIGTRPRDSYPMVSIPKHRGLNNYLMNF